MNRPDLLEFMLKGIHGRDGIRLWETWDTLTPAERARWGFTDDATEPVEPASNVIAFPQKETPRPA